MQINIKGHNVAVYIETCKTIQCERRPEKHLYRNLNAFQFNEEVFKLCSDWEVIEINTRTFRLTINRPEFELFKKTFNVHTRWKDEIQLAIPVAMFEKRDRITNEVIDKQMSILDFCTAINSAPYEAWKNRKICAMLF